MNEATKEAAPLPVRSNDVLCAEQVQETVDQAMADVNVRLAVVTCGCGRKRALVKMYKCFYCETWVCQWCAPSHFGMTKDEYRKKKAHNMPIKGSASALPS